MILNWVCVYVHLYAVPTFYGWVGGLVLSYKCFVYGVYRVTNYTKYVKFYLYRDNTFL